MSLAAENPTAKLFFIPLYSISYCFASFCTAEFKTSLLTCTATGSSFSAAHSGCLTICLPLDIIKLQTIKIV